METESKRLNKSSVELAGQSNAFKKLTQDLMKPLEQITSKLEKLEHTLEAREQDQSDLSVIKALIENLRDRIEYIIEKAPDETETVRMKFSYLNPRYAALFAVKAQEKNIAERRITVESKFEDNLPLVYADGEKTVWTLVHLIGNAVRHSRPGSRIEISAECGDRGVIFCVRDFGEGIALSRQPEIFMRNGADGMSGGVGLSIAKDFVEAQGGRIWVESAAGEGSAFYFSIPAEASE